jgi:predicted transcriptional regulator
LSNLTKIRIEKKGLETILSTLESDIMNILWKRNPLKVKELYGLLKKKHKVAQTSIAVTMDRLYEKKIVDRKIESGRGGLHYLYYPSKTKQEFEKTVVDQTVNKLIEAFGPTAVSYFDERFKKGAANRSKSKRKD